jgi:hypothetical protein
MNERMSGGPSNYNFAIRYYTCRTIKPMRLGIIPQNLGLRYEHKFCVILCSANPEHAGK